MKKNTICFFVYSFIFFLFGLLVGNYKWPPYTLLQNLKKSLIENYSYERNYEKKIALNGEQELLNLVFCDTVSEHNLYYPPISSMDAIYDSNQRIHMECSGFESAYKNIKLVGYEYKKRGSRFLDVLRVNFVYRGKEYEAFAYVTAQDSCHSRDKSTLIIPGSEINQSYGIANGDTTNYHYGILDALKCTGGDVFTLIKPNEDYLAWHNGKGKKLSGLCIWNWHLNRGGSYSVSYIVQSLALMKWMKGQYQKTIVAGLSQGGTATLLNAVQSCPDLAIVCSGTSILMDKVEYAGHNQIIGIPGYDKFFNPDSLKLKLSNGTKWLFTWGMMESDIYRIEAQQQLTKNTLNELPNTTFNVHNAGHCFPVEEIVDFIRKHN